MNQPRSADDLARRLAELIAELGEPMTLDGLTRDFKIFQRRRGHRHSTDDLLTAWYATIHAPERPITTLLDLGAGIGSVGLSLLWHYEEATLAAIEVQSVSYRLLGENVWANGVEARIRMVHGDLRDAVPEGRYDLVTGSPPYFDVKNGIVSADSQRASARFELHGDVSDYCRAAKSALAPDGHFVFCFPTAQRARAERACKEAGLSLFATRDVIPKRGLPPLFSLFACRLELGRMEIEPSLIVREENGVHTAEMNAARAVFGNGRT